MNMPRLAFVAVLVVLLAACGFRPRAEAQLPASMKTLAIVGADPVSPLGRDLRRALSRTGTVVVDGTQAGAAVLRIPINRMNTDVLSVGGNARANEYTMRYTVEFDVVAAGGDVVVPRQAIELTREFTFDATQALGVAAEQDLLTKELQREMVQVILRRIEAAAGAH